MLCALPEAESFIPDQSQNSLPHGRGSDYAGSIPAPACGTISGAHDVTRETRFMQTLADRLEILPQVGRVEWIGLSPHPRGELLSVTEATLLVDHGLEGDHHAKRRAGTKRQVTLIQAEHLSAI